MVALVPSESIQSVATALQTLNEPPLRALSVHGSNNATTAKAKMYVFTYARFFAAAAAAATTTTTTTRSLLHYRDPKIIGTDASPAVVGGCVTVFPHAIVAQDWTHVASAVQKRPLQDPSNRTAVTELIRNLHHTAHRNQFVHYMGVVKNELKRLGEPAFADWYFELYGKPNYDTFNIGAIPVDGVVSNSNPMERSHAVAKQSMAGGIKQTVGNFVHHGLEEYMRVSGTNYCGPCIVDALETAPILSVAKAGDLVGTSGLVKINTFDIGGDDGQMIINDIAKGFDKPQFKKYLASSHRLDRA